MKVSVARFEFRIVSIEGWFLYFSIAANTGSLIAAVDPGIAGIS